MVASLLGIKQHSLPKLNEINYVRGKIFLKSEHFTTLTLKYNHSIFRTYDFARGGATIDRAFIEPLFPTANTFGDQVEKDFQPPVANPGPSSQHNWLLTV